MNIYVKTDESTLSIRQAVELSGVSRQTISLWIKNKKFLVNVLLNGYKLIDRESFMKFIEEKQKENNQ